MRRLIALLSGCIFLCLVSGCGAHLVSVQRAAVDSQTPSGVADNDLAKYQRDYETAKAAYAKKKHSKEAKEAYVITTVRLGTASMYADSLGPKVKYRKALQFYREALKIDPT